MAAGPFAGEPGPPTNSASRAKSCENAVKSRASSVRPYSAHSVRIASRSSSARTRAARSVPPGAVCAVGVAAAQQSIAIRSRVLSASGSPEKQDYSQRNESTPTQARRRRPRKPRPRHALEAHGVCRPADVRLRPAARSRLDRHPRLDARHRRGHPRGRPHHAGTGALDVQVAVGPAHGSLRPSVLGTTTRVDGGDAGRAVRA